MFIEFVTEFGLLKGRLLLSEEIGADGAALKGTAVTVIEPPLCFKGETNSLAVHVDVSKIGFDIIGLALFEPGFAGGKAGAMEALFEVSTAATTIDLFLSSVLDATEPVLEMVAVGLFELTLCKFGLFGIFTVTEGTVGIAGADL